MKNPESKILVLFDFDGTLTQNDTFFEFLFFVNGKSNTIKGFLANSVLFVMYACKILDGGKLKERLLSYFFKGEKKEVLEKFGKNFITYLTERNKYKTDVLQKLKEYKKNNAEVYVVSASTDVWVKEYCLAYNVKCICTELLYINGIFTGEFATPNCNRKEKAFRITKEINLSEYTHIIAYGNSSGDKYMFELADEKIMIK